MAAFAARYARAFGQVVAAAGFDPAAAQDQLGKFAALLEENGDLREVLSNPSIATAQKVGVLDALAGRLELAAPVRNFLAVIMGHQRLAELNEIRAEYALVAAAAEHVVEAEVESAHPLAETERRALTERIAQLAGGEVTLRWSENPELLGGAVIRIGSTVYDGSLRGQFQQMKQQLMRA